MNKLQHGGHRKGAGRPPAQEKMRRRSIGMLESDWQKAQALADREGVSIDEIIRRLVRAAA
mgnify:CR=1 FL=1